jgi:hypothetical protein
MRSFYTENTGFAHKNSGCAVTELWHDSLQRESNLPREESRTQPSEEFASGVMSFRETGKAWHSGPMPGKLWETRVERESGPGRKKRRVTGTSELSDGAQGCRATGIFGNRERGSAASGNRRCKGPRRISGGAGRPAAPGSRKTNFSELPGNRGSGESDGKPKLSGAPGNRRLSRNPGNRRSRRKAGRLAQQGANGNCGKGRRKLAVPKSFWNRWL